MYDRSRNIVVRADGRRVNVARYRGQLFVCATGCCCGRTEDGFAPVPAETLHGEWERRRLRNVVHLSMGGCLGPCALANVALLIFDGQAQWFHSIDSDDLARALYDHVERMLEADGVLPPGGALAARLFTASSWQPRPDGQPVDDARIWRVARGRGQCRGVPLRSDRRWRRPDRGSGRDRHARPGGAPAAERRAGLRGAVAGSCLRDGGRAPRAGRLRVGGVPPDADRPHRGGRAARRPVRLLRDLARDVRGAARPPRGSSPATSWTRPPTSSSSASGTTCSERGGADGSRSPRDDDASTRRIHPGADRPPAAGGCRVVRAAGRADQPDHQALRHRQRPPHPAGRPGHLVLHGSAELPARRRGEVPHLYVGLPLLDRDRARRRPA